MRGYPNTRTQTHARESKENREDKKHSHRIASRGRKTLGEAARERERARASGRANVMSVMVSPPQSVMRPVQRNRTKRGERVRERVGRRAERRQARRYHSFWFHITAWRTSPRGLKSGAPPLITAHLSGSWFSLNRLFHKEKTPRCHCRSVPPHCSPPL